MPAVDGCCRLQLAVDAVLKLTRPLKSVKEIGRSNCGVKAKRTNMTIVPIRPQMTEVEYDRQRAKLRETYGDNSIEAAAKRDQAIAILFYRSGWTQERLAKKERKSDSWALFHVRFGRFLNFLTDVRSSESLPKNLTESRFRSYWLRADPKETNERIRFQAVLMLMRSQSIWAARRPSIGEPIKEGFADGKWHRPSVIAEKIGADEAHVLDTIKGMSNNGTYGCKVERKRVGQQIEFRIFKTDKTVSLDELIEKLAPIIKELKAEGKKNMATMSPATVSHLAGKLSNLLDEWAR